MTSTSLHAKPVPSPEAGLISETRSEASAVPQSDQSGLLPIFTLVLWAGCLLIGIAGWWFPYARPQAPRRTPAPVQAEILQVELTADPAPPVAAAPPPSAFNPPPLINQVTPPQAPPAIAVATPNPAIAFAMPVEGPTRVVEAREASYSRPTAPATANAPGLPVQSLQMNQGEGKQPQPEYPHQAAREGQEGTVKVRFLVGENGRVLTAEAVEPSPWPLLNESALKVIRNRWRFQSGPLRYYEVSLRFQLNQ